MDSQINVDMNSMDNYNNIQSGNSGDSEPQIKVNYLLFGTFMTYCRCIQMNRLSFKLISVLPNISNINFAYNINLAFIDITRIIYCSDETNQLVFIETNKKSNHYIQRAMNLGLNSPDCLRYDVNSDDVVDRYLVIDLFEGEIGFNFIENLIQWSKTANEKIIIGEMLADNARRYIRQNLRKCVASHRTYRRKRELNQSYDSQ